MTFIGGSRSCMYVLERLVKLNGPDVATFSGFKFSQLEMSKRDVVIRGGGLG
jgi:hypothetical protein